MVSRMNFVGWLAAIFVGVSLLGSPQHVQAQPAGTPGTTITVNTPGDNVIVLPGGAAPCTLRDAIEAANTNKKVRGCLAGQEFHVISSSPLRVDFIDRIVFAIGKDTPTIELRRALPIIIDPVTIDGETGDARRVEITGRKIRSVPGSTPEHGLVVIGNYSTFKSLVINGFRGSGILLTHITEDEKPLLEPSVPERPGEKWEDPCDSPSPPMDLAECRADHPPTDPTILTLGTGGGTHTIIDCLIGTDATGTRAVPNGDGTLASAGIVVFVPGNTIGGTAPRMGNVISGNRGNGVLLDSVNNRLIGNRIGVGLGNQRNGIIVDGGQTQTASCDIRNNAIVSNGANGVDAGSNSCRMLSNSIADNGGLGIERAGAGATANDPARNRPPNFPILEAVGRSTNGDVLIFGTIAQSSTQPITLQLFDNRTCDSSGHGEGPSLIKSMSVQMPTRQGTLFRFQIPPLQAAGNQFYTATATTVDGGTSEYSPCLQH